MAPLFKDDLIKRKKWKDRWNGQKKNPNKLAKQSRFSNNCLLSENHWWENHFLSDNKTWLVHLKTWTGDASEFFRMEKNFQLFSSQLLWYYLQQLHRFQYLIDSYNLLHRVKNDKFMRVISIKSLDKIQKITLINYLHNVCNNRHDARAKIKGSKT